jgi:hypothetical protein
MIYPSDGMPSAKATGNPRASNKKKTPIIIKTIFSLRLLKLAAFEFLYRIDYFPKDIHQGTQADGYVQKGLRDLHGLGLEPPGPDGKDIGEINQQSQIYDNNDLHSRPIHKAAPWGELLP